MKIQEGFKNGMLTAVRLTSNSKDGKRRWICVCDCDPSVETKPVYETDLTRKTKSSKSCGCTRRKNVKGKRFGKLIAIQLIFCDNQWKWLCKCDCGKEIIVVVAALN